MNVLVPEPRRRRDIGFVQLSRTSRMPRMIFPDGQVCYVPAVRAVADAVRGMRDLGAVRAIVADGVQRGIVLHFPPRRLRTEPQVVAAEIASALAAGRSRGPLDIKALPAR